MKLTVGVLAGYQGKSAKNDELIAPVSQPTKWFANEKVTNNSSKDELFTRGASKPEDLK